MPLELTATPRGDPARCAYCHDDTWGPAPICPGCGTCLHLACRFLLRRCPTLGCPSNQKRRPRRRIRVRRAREAAEIPYRVERRTRARALFWATSAAAIGILAGVAWSTTPVISTSCTRRDAMRADLGTLENAVRLFQLNTGRWPTCMEELITPAGDVAERWQGPYLAERAPTDPWGNPYRLYPGDPPVLVCLGADGWPGGEGEAADVFLSVRGGSARRRASTIACGSPRGSGGPREY